jgi:hypothetical protein
VAPWQNEEEKSTKKTEKEQTRDRKKMRLLCHRSCLKFVHSFIHSLSIYLACNVLDCSGFWENSSEYKTPWLHDNSILS